MMFYTVIFSIIPESNPVIHTHLLLLNMVWIYNILSRDIFYLTLLKDICLICVHLLLLLF